MDVNQIKSNAIKTINKVCEQNFLPDLYTHWKASTQISSPSSSPSSPSEAERIIHEIHAKIINTITDIVTQHELWDDVPPHLVTNMIKDLSVAF